MALGLRPQGFLAPSSCLSIPDYVPDVSVRGSLCSTTADPLGWDHLGDMGVSCWVCVGDSGWMPRP